ncbi:hypothetical protein [Peptostreptococcus sp. D1]|uniref:hypothetical protein n=1 Tax=Peptostreptococcus sp. D1 TaxID=72304 RepID=UPI0008E1C61F|nr:hypothetical protein [Peptostreptococcus sp. D1]SFE87550.1 hypothetical protein SAMN02910278_01931 [Peptostreptococcus sp. D1]
MAWNDNASMYDEHLINYKHELDKSKVYFEEIKDSLNDKSSEFESSNVSNVEELKNWIKKTSSIVKNPKLNFTYHENSYIKGFSWGTFSSLRGVETRNGTKVVVASTYPNEATINIKTKGNEYKKVKTDRNNKMLLLFAIDDDVFYIFGGSLMKYNVVSETETEIVIPNITMLGGINQIGIDEASKKFVYGKNYNELLIYDCENNTIINKKISQVDVYPNSVVCHNNYIYVIGTDLKQSGFSIAKFDYDLNFISKYNFENLTSGNYGGNIIAGEKIYLLQVNSAGVYKVFIFNLDTFSFLNEKNIVKENEFWQSVKAKTAASGTITGYNRDIIMDDKFNINCGLNRKSLYGTTQILDFETETIFEIGEINKYNRLANMGAFIDKNGHFNQILSMIDNSDNSKAGGTIYERIFSI